MIYSLVSVERNRDSRSKYTETQADASSALFFLFKEIVKFSHSRMHNIHGNRKPYPRPPKVRLDAVEKASRRNNHTMLRQPLKSSGLVLVRLGAFCQLRKDEDAVSGRDELDFPISECAGENAVGFCQPFCIQSEEGWQLGPCQEGLEIERGDAVRMTRGEEGHGGDKLRILLGYEAALWSVRKGSSNDGV
jgi:hypothetical protein